MTVEELIKQLSTFPPEANVWMEVENWLFEIREVRQDSDGDILLSDEKE